MTHRGGDNGTVAITAKAALDKATIDAAATYEALAMKADETFSTALRSQVSESVALNAGATWDVPAVHEAFTSPSYARAQKPTEYKGPPSLWRRSENNRTPEPRQAAGNGHT